MPSLHWRPGKYRMAFKTLLCVFKAFNERSASHFSDLLPCCSTRRDLKSANQLLFHWLMEKEVRVFSLAALRLWNDTALGPSLLCVFTIIIIFTIIPDPLLIDYIHSSFGFNKVPQHFFSQWKVYFKWIWLHLTKYERMNTSLIFLHLVTIQIFYYKIHKRVKI